MPYVMDESVIEEGTLYKFLESIGFSPADVYSFHADVHEIEIRTKAEPGAITYTFARSNPKL